MAPKISWFSTTVLLFMVACGPSEEGFVVSYCDLAYECYPDEADSFENAQDCIDGLTMAYVEDLDCAYDFDASQAAACLDAHDPCPNTALVPECYDVWICE